MVRGEHLKALSEEFKKAKLDNPNLNIKWLDFVKMSKKVASDGNKETL